MCHVYYENYEIYKTMRTMKTMKDLNEKNVIINVSLVDNDISTKISYDKDSVSGRPISDRPNSEKVNNLIQRLCNKFSEKDDFFFIKHGNKLVKIDSNHIMYLEAARNYCDIVLYDKTVFDVSMPMREVHELLDINSFYRINRSNVVNINYVKEIMGNMVKLNDGKLLDIGNTYREQVFSQLNIIGSRKRVKERTKGAI